MQLGPRFFLIYLPSNARKIRLADQASFVSRGNQFTTYDARNKWYYSVKRGLVFALLHSQSCFVRLRLPVVSRLGSREAPDATQRRKGAPSLSVGRCVSHWSSAAKQDTLAAQAHLHLTSVHQPSRQKKPPLTDTCDRPSPGLPLDSVGEARDFWEGHATLSADLAASVGGPRYPTPPHGLRPAQYRCPRP